MTQARDLRVLDSRYHGLGNREVDRAHFRPGRGRAPMAMVAGLRSDPLLSEELTSDPVMLCKRQWWQRGGWNVARLSGVSYRLVGRFGALVGVGADDPGADGGFELTPTPVRS